jgi:hypothetical protein
VIGYDLPPAEALARALFGVEHPGAEPEPDRAAELGLDFHAYLGLRTAAEEFAAWHGRHDEPAIRFAEQQLLVLLRTVNEAIPLALEIDALLARPRRTRMHAAYRIKTRRRNRR